MSAFDPKADILLTCVANGITQSRQLHRRAIDPHSVAPDISGMALVRAILAALIAISVAVVPTTGGTALSTNPAKISMADQADMPCCPPPDEGKVSPACAFKCLNFVAALFPATIALSHIVDGPPQSFSDGILYGYISPPTHPPPI